MRSAGLWVAAVVHTLNVASAASLAGQCEAGAPRCVCYNREDDEAPCAEGRSFARLLEWMQHGVDEYVAAEDATRLPRLVDLMEMRRTPHGERVVIARRDLHEGELIMKLPVQRLMHAGFWKGVKPVNAEPSEEDVLLEQLELGRKKSNLPPPPGPLAGARAELAAAMHLGLRGQEFTTFVAAQTWLALYMMEHRHLGTASEWRVYLDMLPEKFPSMPIFYREEDLRWLQGSQFASRVRKHQKSMRSQYDTVSALVPWFNQSYSLDEFLWARSAISSRVFGWPLPGLSEDETDFMVPLGDMFNHRSPKQIEWRMNSTTQTLDYWVLENVSAGSEMLISYGGKCNSAYLLHYGFTLPNVWSRKPPVSTVRILASLDDEVPDRAKKEAWLLRQKMTESDVTELEPEEFELKAAWIKSGDGEKLLGYARLLELPTGDDFERRMKSRTCKQFTTPPRCEQAISLANELAALQRCLGVVKAALDGYPTTLDEDVALLPSLSGLPLTLVTLRRDEKVVLNWWHDFFAFALEMAKLSESQAEQMIEEKYGRFSPESQYLRVTLRAVVAIAKGMPPS
eukprot:gnl/TRDRNA2_/TRDRNA2_83912_c0_seq1.p1 gnl/TRDRNA2_/TRDRNA2_83912_c0~~gnl/TRDRNA2_/TRDRNA2_83912_c0_seq1.p1  ORF type:complete len:569 (-),score=106.36 gnl/TRDRNA2_/TRDRNA2_83912_c0_seq1:224-1930(-)